MSKELPAQKAIDLTASPHGLLPASLEKIVVSDDWTRNWQAKIAVKIAAMFIWILIATAFAGVVYYTHDLDKQVEKTLRHDLDGLGYRIQTTLQALPSLTLDSGEPVLKRVLEAEVSDSDFDGITLELGQEQLTVGHTDGRVADTRTLMMLPPDNPDGDQYASPQIQLNAYHLPVATIVEHERNRLIVTVVLALAIFGLLLIWTIHNVLSKPLRSLTDATKAISSGDLGLRLDASRQDEFGHLSRFFNQMLDRVQEHQFALSGSNQELTREIGVRRQIEAELRGHQNKLENLVELRTKDLEAARDMALQASHTKSAFIANISHEIRTPLTPIIGFAESMLQDDPPPDTRKALLTSIIRNGRHLFNLINEILDLSKIEANKLEIEKIDVDISQLFLDIESVIGVLARDKGLAFYKGFTKPVPRHFHSDPTRIKQILMNLLTNAIKFTEKGNIGLFAEFDPDKKLLYFTVSDTGIGIPEDKQDRLFKAFSQADSSTTRRYGGTGLGLYISQRLAKLLEGDVTVNSLDGVGTKFIVSIRADGEHLNDLISLPDESASLSYAATELMTHLPRLGGHVLLAEDSPDNQSLITHYIGKTGASVSVADNGQTALEMALAGDYDLILMDMQMPVMSGAEAIELLRASGSQTPIVALTANAMKGDRDNYIRIGCNDFLGKPIRQAIFYQVLANYLPAAGEGETLETSTNPLVDDEFLAMQASFQASLPGYVERLRNAMAAEDHGEIQEEAHKLKGLGGSFGFPEITAQAALLETSIKSAQFSSSPFLCESLCGLLTQAAKPRLPIMDTTPMRNE